MSPVDETLRRLLDDVDAGWDDLLRALDGIEDDDLLEPGMTGTWSGKDTLAHISRWDTYIDRALTSLVRDGVALDGGYQAVIDRLLVTNDIWAAEDADLPLDHVKRAFHDNHAALISTLRALSPEQSGGDVRMWVRALIEHYPEHTPLILEWKQGRNR